VIIRQTHPFYKNRAGIAPLDVLIVICIVTLLISLLMPAIVSMRESARSSHCRSNLARIANALSSYHDSFDSFPPTTWFHSSNFKPNLERIAASNITRESYDGFRAGWASLVLPFLNANSTASPPPDRSIMAEEESIFRTTSIPTYNCPADNHNNSANKMQFKLVNGNTAEFARGNYALNGGTQIIFAYPGFISYPVPNGVHATYESATNGYQLWGSGVGGFNKTFRIQDFKNGSSSMVLLNEIRAGIDPLDPRGAWALGDIGASVTWAHGVNGDAFGPNNQYPASDDLLEGTGLHQLIGAERIKEEQMPFCDHCECNSQAGSRSRHQGGVNLAFVDGSAKFINNDISPSLWHVLHSRETPSEVLTERQASLIASKTPINTSLPLQSPDITSLTNSIGMEFSKIPAGEFIMGLPNAELDEGFWPHDEAPSHKVIIPSPFLMGICEVTQSQYESVIGSNPSWHNPNGEGKSEVDSGKSTALHPVENVTWYQAVKFCQMLSEFPQEKAAKRSYRLPTEAEWEYCCRSGSSEPYPFSTKWDTFEINGEMGGKDLRSPPVFSMPVKSFPPNPFGLYDIRGSVFEWTNDWFKRDYYRESLEISPPGPEYGYLKVIRGWDWRFIGEMCKHDYTPTEPWRKSPFIGFRVICVQ